MSTQGDSAAADGNNEGSGDPLCESLTRTQAEAAEEAKRLKEKADECEAESERKRSAARKLVEEADVLNEKSRKLKEEAKAAEDLSASMHFEATLRRLKLNDSSLVTVDTREFPKGYGTALAAALLENTVVETLELAFDTFLCDGQEEKEFKPIIKFLATSPSLKKLGTCVGRQMATRNLANSILSALSENKRLEILIWNLHVPPVAFCNLLREVQSLKKMGVAFFGAHQFSNAEKQMVASAFGDNKNLEWLKLPSPHFADFISLILANLHRLQSLRELVFFHGGPSALQHPFDAISQYLGTTETLHRFELSDISLGDSHMERILSGLVQVHGVTGMRSTTLSELALTRCTVDRDAIERLAAFLQTRTTNSDGGNIIHDSSLDFLRIDTSPDERSCKMLANSFLMASDGPTDASKKSKVSQLLPTVGSQIAFLSMRDVHPVFLDRLRRNSHRVALKTLQLFSISKRSSVALCKCLPQLLSLENLYMHNAESGSAPWITHGLNRNGSVGLVEIGGVHDFDVTRIRLIDAYCDRNKSLERLIATEPSCSDSSNDKSENSGALAAGRNAALGLRTSLLQTAHAIPKKRSAMFIQGLLTLGQRCGYGQGHDNAVSDNLEST